MNKNDQNITRMESIHERSHLKNKFLFPIIFVLISILQFYGLFIFNKPDHFAPDSTGYHALAVNILKYGVYNSSINTKDNIDYEPHFIREPGYPLFLAGVYGVCSMVGDVSHISSDGYDLNAKKLLDEKREVRAVQYIQFFLMVMSVLFFYQTLQAIHISAVNKIVSVASLLFVPFIQMSINILREPLITFLLALFAYLLALYLKKGDHLYLWCAVLLIALASLTWQVMIVFTILVFIAMLLRKETFLKAIVCSVFYGVLFIAIMMPWLLKVYAYYPDIRILKSGGTSLTHEVMTTNSAIYEAKYYGRMSSEDISNFEHTEYYPLSSREVFDRSFNGWYNNIADSIRAEIGSTNLMHYKFVAYRMTTRLKNLLFHKNWWPVLKYKFWDPRNNTLLKFILYGISALLAILFPLGIIKLSKQQIVFFMPYILYGALFMIIGSESRRFVPIIPFMLFCSVNLIRKYKNNG
ncbi:MAG: hypothetical protein PHC50_01795 [Candidatus Cloacimonetes bacterium]|nr:hypothetical protein [Candidatus Cloacimonadota bacterium]